MAMLAAFAATVGALFATTAAGRPASAARLDPSGSARGRSRGRRSTPLAQRARPLGTIRPYCSRHQPSRATLSPRARHYPPAAFSARLSAALPSWQFGAVPLWFKPMRTALKKAPSAPALLLVQTCSDAPLWMRVVTHRIRSRQRTSARCYHAPAADAKNLADVGALPASNLEEEFPAVHPQKQQPVAGEDGAAAKKRLEACAEECEKVGAEVDAEGAADKALEEVGHAVGGD